MRALAALRMVWARRRLGNGGGDLVVGILATWCVRKLRGPRGCGRDPSRCIASLVCGPLAVSRVVNGAGDARLARE
jgi:hypothetical protein